MTAPRPPRLIHGLFGAALAAALLLARGNAPPAATGPAAIGTSTALAGLPASLGPELRTRQERIPKAPPEQAARTRRTAASGATGILPAPIAAPAVAPVVYVIGSSKELPVSPSECGHCTVAPRPPPISQ
jgi:hypothetical protein